MLLKEKIYIRYLIGLIMCLIGALLIILNEKSSKLENHNDKLMILLGAISGLGMTVFIACNVVAQKILVKEINQNDLCYYIAVTNGTIGLTVFILNGDESNLYPPYVLMCMTNGLIFYFIDYFRMEAVKGIDLIKVTPLAYINTLTAFFLGAIFIDEPVFFTDVIGSLLIISFNVYNALFPL